MPGPNEAMVTADGSARVNASGAWVVTDGTGAGGGCGGVGGPCCSGGFLCAHQTATGATASYSVTIAYTHVVRVVNASGTFVTTTTSTGTHSLPGSCVFMQGSTPGEIVAEPVGAPPFTTPTTCGVAWQARLSGPGLSPVGPIPIPNRNVTVRVGAGNAEFFATTDNGSFSHWKIGFGPGRYAYSWLPPDVGTTGNGAIGPCGAFFGGTADWDSRIANGGSGFPYSLETLSVQVVVAPVGSCASADSEGCSDCGDEGLAPA